MCGTMELWPGVDVGWGFVGGVLSRGSIWFPLSMFPRSSRCEIRLFYYFFVLFVFLVHQCLFLGFWCVECWYYLVYVFIYFVPY